MILRVDTRQKKGKHTNIELYCKEHGIDCVPEALKVGDYMFPNGNVSVDTKNGLLELVMDLHSDKSRFYRELARSVAIGIKLYILVETNEVKTLKDIASWRNPNYKNHKLCMQGRELMERIYTAQISYNVQFVFCRKNDTGKTLISLLRGDKNGN